MTMIDNSIKFKGYKSFVNEFAEINPIKKINVFIGRNNCGKSSCLDIIENLINPEIFKFNTSSNNELDIELSCTLTDQMIGKVFSKDWHGGDIPGRNHYEFGENYIGKTMWFSLSTRIKSDYSKKLDFKYNYLSDPVQFNTKFEKHWKEFEESNEINKFSNTIFRRINAERNIVPEQEQDDVDIDFFGSGASNLVRKILNNSNYDEKLIEITLLEELNKIIYPDSQFTGIRTQQITENGLILWEIFLQEGKSRYALSKMGSGLKTIILVLLNLLIIPKIEKYNMGKIIFAFEELENNLHPALQRRLFDYLYDFSQKTNLPIFLTTHSHVAINAFSDKDEAQIYHVIKENSVSTLNRIDDYMTKATLLDDLDVRASDLLQSNGIIWVEGPSDRVYIKHWLNIFCEHSLIEGRDYQFLYYGGRLLAHYTLDAERQNLINILLTNRNSIIVIDSDKKSRGAKINDTKNRIEEEFKKYKCFCWITKGKEIENYIPIDAIEKTHGKKIKNALGQYELFPDYIHSLEPTFTNNKVAYANKVCKNITVENSELIYDLKDKITTIYNTIKLWNRI